jgi:hypothetical protein
MSTDPTERQSTSKPRARGRWALLLNAFAILWSLLLLVGALAIPTYDEQTTSAHRTITLVAENGAWILLPLAIPLLLTGAAGWLLHSPNIRNSGRARSIAWVLTGVLLAFCVISIASVGLFLAPAALAMLGAMLLTSPRPRRDIARGSGDRAATS